MRQRQHSQRLVILVRHGLGAGQRILAVDIHRARPADTLSARSSEGQRGINVVLDPDQSIQDHWTAVTGINEVSVQSRISAVLGIPPVYLELTDAIRLRFGPGV